MWVFFNSKYYGTAQSVVGWIRGYGTSGTDESRIEKTDYKLHADFRMCRGLVPQPHMLFKGQLYFKSARETQ